MLLVSTKLQVKLSLRQVPQFHLISYTKTVRFHNISTSES